MGHSGEQSPADNAVLQEVASEIMARWPSREDFSHWPRHWMPPLNLVRALMNDLGDPQKAYPSIHITGTNGKTSTARMIDSLLRASGWRTGRLTSPHLQKITERISVDGAPISVEEFVGAYRGIRPFVTSIDAREKRPLYFSEVLAAMAYQMFAEARIDAAVVEVGMGGRRDSTNVIDGSVAVITPIDLDHTEFLGDTPEQIAQEKSGIIKHGATVALARQSAGVESVVLRRAAEVDATVAREGVDFSVISREAAGDGQRLTLRGLGGDRREIFLPLRGAHMAQNAAVALAAVEAFAGSRTLDEGTIRQAFGSITSPGRLELISTNPRVILDAAHNLAVATAVASARATLH